MLLIEGGVPPVFISFGSKNIFEFICTILLRISSQPNLHALTLFNVTHVETKGRVSLKRVPPSFSFGAGWEELVHLIHTLDSLVTVFTKYGGTSIL